MDVEIATATPDDAGAVQRVARESWHAAHDGVVGPDVVETAIDEWYDVDSLAASMDRDDGRFLVARADGAVVGFAQAVLGDEDDPAYLARIYVAPHCWGEGVGTDLLGRLERWLREAGADRLRLAVMTDNEVGNAFYGERGYRVLDEREGELFGATFEESIREKRL
ncbi:GNAT family N-acetyltransferase [Halorussus halobius]|uniref:GNAT family N-acetyltransferase n=1 Tax=Halorussus halobius TaxID=1710537 RepID=UPI001092DE1C|nr:GNAT family N-acetyltransferase [Halorussus halobius]